MMLSYKLRAVKKSRYYFKRSKLFADMVIINVRRLRTFKQETALVLLSAVVHA